MSGRPILRNVKDMNNNCFAGRLVCQESVILGETLTEVWETIEGRHAHVHRAESNCRESGQGHTELTGIECALAEIECDGNTAFEGLLSESRTLRRLGDSTRYLLELRT